jgi:hypothetical protein
MMDLIFILGLNPYLYSGMMNYAAYSPANLMYNPYNNMGMGLQSAALLANYNALNGLSALNPALNGLGGINSLNPALNNQFSGLGNSNFLDSGSSMSGLTPLMMNRGLRNRLPSRRLSFIF